ncbi:MAG: tRNA pseudouridine(55) synthase TruB [Anaerolineae bacterium]|nr:tRNA pseudouridine(55) synthase TruB [Anaerolineae bacterium]MDQ7035405.1 tRNA pseudouridine(55) synthase TruB [Anaerolineae bacterium]
MPEQVMGFLNVNKPSGLTSFDVVARVRRLSVQTTATKKVGHAGTLDPMATGVLVVCVGQATRLSSYAMKSKKEYRATVHLGIETDTYDAEGKTVATTDSSHITQEQVESVLGDFRGAIQQLPPMYSAIKKDGKKLYELARQGKAIDVEARPVTLYSIDIVVWDAPQFILHVKCSPGTYIRSLAHDIGQKLGVGAHLAALERTRSGGFHVENAVELDTLLASEDWQQYLISPKVALSNWQSIQLSDEQVNELQVGRFIANETNTEEPYIMAYMPDGHLLAILENRGKLWKPHKVFLPTKS